MNYTVPDKVFIQKAFDSITPKYDLLNQILSFGQADRWRQRAARILLEGIPSSAGTILDLGCGTGDSLKGFLAAKKWERAVGLDFSEAMLSRARQKIPEAEFIHGDLHELPFPDKNFDIIFSAFTLRSVQDMPRFLQGVFRVLKPGGRVGFLELTRPRNLLHRLFFFPYLKLSLPVVGWLVSGNPTAYQFLSKSVETFQPPEKILERMREAGFRDCSMKSFSFGAVTLMIGRK